MLVEGRRKQRLDDGTLVGNKGTQESPGRREKAFYIRLPGLCPQGLELPSRDSGVWNQGQSRERPLLSQAEDRVRGS